MTSPTASELICSTYWTSMGNGYVEQADFERVIGNYAQIAGWEANSQPYEEFTGYVMSWWDMLRAGADADSDNAIDRGEFSALFAQMEESPGKIAEAARTVFDVLDADRAE